MRAFVVNTKIDLKPKHQCLLITGDGKCLKTDVEEFEKFGIDHDIGCIGRSIKLFPYADHWFNADGETAIAWVKQLSKNGLITHTLGPVDGFDVDWDIDQPDYRYKEITNEGSRMHGSSALFATLAAIEMGYKRIVLAGCPMDSEGHWYFDRPDNLGPIWLGVDYMAWIDFRDMEISKKVKSMSGYTAGLLGRLNELR